MSTDDIYHRQIVRLAREAAGAGCLEDADGAATLDSPLCGDEVTLQVKLRGGKVAAVAHRVRGCILCQAAASILGRAAVGVAPGEILDVRSQLAAMLASGAAVPGGGWAELSAFDPVRAAPSRHGCLLLPFDALAEALAQVQARSSEEPDPPTPRSPRA